MIDSITICEAILLYLLLLLLLVEMVLIGYWKMRREYEGLNWIFRTRLVDGDEVGGYFYAFLRKHDSSFLFVTRKRQKATPRKRDFLV